MKFNFTGKSLTIALVGLTGMLLAGFSVPKVQALTLQEILQGYDNSQPQTPAATGQVLGLFSRKKVKPISLEGRNAANKKPKAKVDLISPTTGQVLSTQNLDADSDGNYNVDFSSLAPGSVKLKFKAEGFLAKTITVTNPTATGTAEIPLPELSGGDVNNDGVVNSQDAADLKTQWNSDATTSEAYDINGDGLVNSLDFAIIKNNLNKTGE